MQDYIQTGVVHKKICQTWAEAGAQAARLR